MSTQQIASIARQVGGMIVSIYGILTLTAHNLNIHSGPASAVLVAVGPIILAIEHYVADPSTGTPVVPPTPVKATAVPKPTPEQVVAAQAVLAAAQANVPQ